MNYKQSRNRIIAALQCEDLSRKQLVQKTGLCRHTVKLYLTELKELRMIHIRRYQASGARQEAIYTFSDGVDAISPTPEPCMGPIPEIPNERPAPIIGPWHSVIFPRYTPADSLQISRHRLSPPSFGRKEIS